MFEVNDIVLYNRTEVCRVHEIRPMAFLGGERINYYVLKPVCEESPSNSTVYVPVDADEARIRRAFSAGELRGLLADRSRKAPWLDAPLMRKKEYTEILGRSQPSELLALIRTLSHHRAELTAAGRKFSEADEKYLVAAQKKLFPLFRYILGVDWEDFQKITEQ